MIPELARIGEELRGGRPVPPVTVRTFLSWFSAQRRGNSIVAEIKKQLKEARVITFPDFEPAWIDSPIGFVLENSEQATDLGTSTDGDSTATVQPVEEELASGPEVTNRISRDPTYRVSKLQAANQKIVSIKPDGTLAQAVTLLMAGGYSQLPVMTNERDVKGIVTWKSIGSRLALGVTGVQAREFMDPHQEIRSDTSIFNAIPIIIADDYVLVRGIDNRITGIITSSDLSLQFRLLTEPFLLLSEIENLVRNMIGNRFSPAELASARDPSSTDRAIHTAADMTFGEYIRLLQNPDGWTKLRISVDRTIFCENLDRVREIRNDVTHFDPDGITDGDLERLRDFTNFLKQLEIISAAA
jgi:predicted transcriptional regulator